MDGDIGMRSETQRFPQKAREPAGLDDANLIHPRLPHDGGRVLLTYDERDVGPGKSLPNRANRGNVEKEIAELVLSAVEVEAARLRIENRLGRRSHAQEPEGLPDLARSFSSSRTLTRRSWQDAGISVFS